MDFVVVSLLLLLALSTAALVWGLARLGEQA
jgi:hypothetical protein